MERKDESHPRRHLCYDTELTASVIARTGGQRLAFRRTPAPRSVQYRAATFYQPF
jgi:hypothetical protein